MANILIIDDETRLLRSLSFFFEDEGHQVVTATNGEEGLHILEQGAIDACVVDMRLPGMDGNEIIRRAINRGLLNRFIVHTGSTDYLIPQDLLQLGITKDHVFLKPVADLNILVQAIESILEENN